MGTRVDTLKMASRGLSECLKEVQMKSVFYFKDLNSVGGVESFLYYLAKKYDFEVYYKTGNENQVKRLSQLVKVRKYREPIKCDKFFCNYGLDIEVDAKEKYHIVHCDYKNVWFKPIQYEGFKYIGVSKLVCDSFKELTGKDIELIYNPIYIDKIERQQRKDDTLHLISATRLTREKGLKRMQKLAHILEKNKIKYDWKIFTNRRREGVGGNAIYLEPQLDIAKEIAKADYLVQLSDCEAYCYSVVEALTLGIPVIATDLPVFKELGLNETNAIICNMEMTNFDINKLKKDYNFKYEPPKETWGNHLSNKKEYNPDEKVNVKVLRTYTDIELGQKLFRNQIVEMKQSRASYLESKDLVEICS